MSVLRLVARIPFTFFGIASIAALILTGSGTLPLEGFWHVLMLPSYLLHVAVAIVAIALVGDPPGWLWLVSLVFQLSFFAFLDVLLARYRASRARRAAERPGARGT
jgi:hypothetical protein